MKQFLLELSPSSYNHYKGLRWALDAIASDVAILNGEDEELITQDELTLRLDIIAGQSKNIACNESVEHSIDLRHRNTGDYLGSIRCVDINS